MFISYSKKQLLKYVQVLLAAMAVVGLGFAGFYFWDMPKMQLWSENRTFLLILLVALTGYLWGIHQGETKNKRRKILLFTLALIACILLRLTILAAIVHTTAFILSMVGVFGLFTLMLITPIVLQMWITRKKRKTIA